MKKRRTIWQWFKDWWTPDDEEDADGYPGDVCLRCGGRKEILFPESGELKSQFLVDEKTFYPVRFKAVVIVCPACKGKGTV